MSGRSLVGLVAFDGLLLLTGYAVLYPFVGRYDRGRLLRYGGIAFWVGAAVLGLVLTLVAVITSLGPRWWFVLVVALSVSATGVALGSWRQRASVCPPVERGPFGLAAAPFAAATGMILAALFAAAYNKPLAAWDSWAFWIPKAKTLFYSGSLDPSAITSFSGTTYPLLVPVLHAAAFGFMDSADTVAIHLQPWVFVAAFVWACVGLLRPRCPHALIWPFLALLIVLPSLDDTVVLKPDGDYPSVLLFALGAIALLRWVEDEEPWALAVGGLFLAAAASAKREGTAYLLAAFLAGYVVTATKSRKRWPLLTLVAAAALATTIPWRLWLRAHAVVADSMPPSGVLSDSVGNGGLGKGIEVVFHYLFSYSQWSIAPWLGVIVLAAGIVIGPRRRDSCARLACALVRSPGCRRCWCGEPDPTAIRSAFDAAPGRLAADRYGTACRRPARGLQSRYRRRRPRRFAHRPCRHGRSSRRSSRLVPSSGRSSR